MTRRLLAGILLGVAVSTATWAPQDRTTSESDGSIGGEGLGRLNPSTLPATPSWPPTAVTSLKQLGQQDRETVPPVPSASESAAYKAPRPVPTHTGRGALSYTGDINFADVVHGGNYLAMRLPRGTIVTICGAGGCWENARVNDYGPVAATGDLADVAFVKFMKVCGYNREKARQMGECVVTIKVGGIPLPPTDTN